VDETKKTVSVGAKFNDHQPKSMPQDTEQTTDQRDAQSSESQNTSSVNDQAK